MTTENKIDDRSSPDYLTQLLRDKKHLQAFPNLFSHTERLLDDEINRVRIALFHNKPNNTGVALPDPLGPVVTLTEKVWVPTEQYPEFNFVGRILGPRGMTLKDLESQTGCKILVRGKGSLRERQKEEANKGKPNWEHLNENLHVLISVEDTQNRAEIKMQAAILEINKFLVPTDEKDDNIKKNQLMELAIFNGTFRNGRDNPQPLQSQLIQAQRLVAPTPLTLPQIRSPTGTPIILAPRFPIAHLNGGVLSTAPPPLVSPTDHSALMYNPYELPYLSTTNFTQNLFEYSSPLETSPALGALPKIRRTLSGVREHPYTRIVPVSNISQ